jgi:hypothetical protein
MFGPAHLDTLNSMAHLAFTCRDQGRWVEAERLYLQVIETSQTVLGPDHPNTLTGIAHLASTYLNQG